MSLTRLIVWPKINPMNQKWVNSESQEISGILWDLGPLRILQWPISPVSYLGKRNRNGHKFNLRNLFLSKYPRMGLRIKALWPVTGLKRMPNWNSQCDCHYNLFSTNEIKYRFWTRISLIPLPNNDKMQANKTINSVLYLNCIVSSHRDSIPPIRF